MKVRTTEEKMYMNHKHVVMESIQCCTIVKRVYLSQAPTRKASKLCI